MKKILTVFLAVFCLITTMLVVLAVVESSILGNHARIILYPLSTIFIAIGFVGWWSSNRRKTCLISGILGIAILATLPVAFTRLNRGSFSGSKNPSLQQNVTTSPSVSSDFRGSDRQSNSNSIEAILYDGFPETGLFSSQSASEENSEYREYLSYSLRESQERNRIDSENETWRTEQRRTSADREAATLKREQEIQRRALEVLNENNPAEKEKLRKKFESDVRRIQSLPLRNRTVEVANQVGYVFSWQPDWIND
ncbi:hypothetical protein [Puniceicoccus vermicola]|uniref:Uncharacterized protein n=1 Tax=Puniceicoccus vermicola TaxID=388746 RepID=A0A7X1E5H6_9BACT|nr:hypothetical protein [Puniceicoccus vermicola]MBC2603154.1 hypothetical protein [Puniceicoccus vermicola]